MLGRSTHRAPESIYIHFYMFSSFYSYISMKWNKVYGGPFDFLLTTSQLLILIKITVNYTLKNRIFTGKEIYLNT